MSLDYKRNYKTMLRRRKIIMISVIVTVFVCASFAVLYFRYWAGEDQQTQQDTQQTIETSSETTSEMKQTEATGARKGKALTRQPIYLYTIGTARVEFQQSTERAYRLSEETVSDSYFDDALFIGDSRTEGFMLYTSLSNLHAYCSKGLSVSRIYTDTIVPMEDGRTVTVMEALQEQSYAKIYIMFGVNELGWPYDDLFREQYSKLIKDIKTLQPDALIYVQNIIPIAASRSATDPIYNNENVNRFNGIIQEICQEQAVIYLDVGSALSDENGALPEDASPDGVHCNREYCEVWLDYLRNHTYVLE